MCPKGKYRHATGICLPLCGPYQQVECKVHEYCDQSTNTCQDPCLDQCESYHQYCDPNTGHCQSCDYACKPVRIEVHPDCSMYCPEFYRNAGTPERLLITSRIPIVTSLQFINLTSHGHPHTAPLSHVTAAGMAAIPVALFIGIALYHWGVLPSFMKYAPSSRIYIHSSRCDDSEESENGLIQSPAASLISYKSHVSNENSQKDDSALPTVNRQSCGMSQDSSVQARREGSIHTCPAPEVTSLTCSDVDGQMEMNDSLRSFDSWSSFGLCLSATQFTLNNYDGWPSPASTSAPARLPAPTRLPAPAPLHAPARLPAPARLLAPITAHFPTSGTTSDPMSPLASIHVSTPAPALAPTLAPELTPVLAPTLAPTLVPIQPHAGLRTVRRERFIIREKTRPINPPVPMSAQPRQHLFRDPLFDPPSGAGGFRSIEGEQWINKLLNKVDFIMYHLFVDEKITVVLRPGEISLPEAREHLVEIGIPENRLNMEYFRDDDTDSDSSIPQIMGAGLPRAGNFAQCDLILSSPTGSMRERIEERARLVDVLDGFDWIVYHMFHGAALTVVIRPSDVTLGEARQQLVQHGIPEDNLTLEYFRYDYESSDSGLESDGLR